jgi:hypothetical protein
MKRLLIVLTFLPVSSISAFAQRGIGQGGGMMDGWGWGRAASTGFDWILIIVIVSFVILGAVYLIIRKQKSK